MAKKNPMPVEQQPVKPESLMEQFMRDNPPPAPVGEQKNNKNDAMSGMEKTEQTGESLMDRFMAENPPPESSGDPVTQKTIKDAASMLQKYRQGKANLEHRIVDDERWYTMHADDAFRDGNATPSNDEQQDSAWMFNSLANKHADFMDNYPEPNVLPRAQDDEQTARTLSSVLTVALENNDYEQVYSDAVWYKLKHGTSCKTVIWDRDKLNGLGDISIRNVDLLNLFWEPGITDIQQSRNIFHVELVDNDVLKETYPELKELTGTPTVDVTKYIYDDTIDTSDKSAVIDWYYKKNGLLHYCKFVNDTVLFASENNKQEYPNGWYDHGQYPFVLDTLHPRAHTPVGFGYIAVMKQAQRSIDRLDRAVLLSAMNNAKPRYFIRRDGAVNEEEFADLNRDFIHADGNLGDDSIKQVVAPQLDSIVPTVLMNKISELKETSGNRDFSQGGTTSGVSAASAIAALQEAGSKLSRDMIQGAYRAYVKECYLCIELMRQFYDVPREFRITGEDTVASGNTYDFVTFSNDGLKPQGQGNALGVDFGNRMPVFDIKVSAARKSTYSRASQNELAKELYKLGLFNPDNGDQAMTTLSMMDFDGKDKIVAKVQQNMQLYKENQMLAEQVAKLGLVAAQQGVAMGDANAAEAGSAITQNALASARNAQDKNGGANASNVQSSAQHMTINPLGDAVTGNSLSTQARRRAMNVSNPNR